MTRRGYARGPVAPLARAHELREAGDLALHVLEPALLERAGDLVAPEHPQPRRGADQRAHRRRRQRRAGRGQDRQAAARGEHALHRVERGQRRVEQVQRGEAADGVEAAVAERQPDRVAAHVGDVASVCAGVLDRAREHRLRRVEPDHQPALADRARELAHEVARPAGDVEHGVARPQLEQLVRDLALALGPRPQRPHQHAPPRRPPPALVDDRQAAREHQPLRRAPAAAARAAQQVEIAVGNGCALRSPGRIEQADRALEAGRERHAGCHPMAGATCSAIVSSRCALYSTPSWFGTVSSSVSASRTATSRASSSAITSGSPM